MKTTVETSLILESVDGNLTKLMIEFNKLLIICTGLSTETELRKLIKREFENSVNFKCGFGASHMWVHQIVKGHVCGNRLLILEFFKNNILC